ncbi:type II toxin-antitoxin system VapC family toxin [uncultured Roseobacter sp.]|uniref:type II toxin-antitoxin system VapC family toxin n=1 Tax=uncultured Roseobacter sp. TaxID=114847 RepID=UPI00261B804A|nr:type II toxin-antitoxin system VapC family toxin [uncultured Roseobacter sp.]
MIYLLDTNVVSELRKAGDGKADANVAEWASLRDPEELYISVITLLELEVGVLRIERRDDKQGQMLRIWLEHHVIPFFQDRILPVDEHVAIGCARLHVPNKSPERDALIAATANELNMTIATRDEKDFRDLARKTFNPWSSMKGTRG